MYPTKQNNTEKRNIYNKFYDGHDIVSFAYIRGIEMRKGFYFFSFVSLFSSNHH